MSYIYLVTNNINGKQYVGQHRYEGKGLDPSYHGSGRALHKAYKKYGIENFTMELLEECADEDMNPLEQLYIEHYNTFTPYGYNLTKGGDGNVGYVASEETKKKLSEAHKNNPLQSKRIAQFSSDGKFIQSFPSSKEAERQLNINASHINECCRGKRNKIGGYIWIFYENNNDLTDLSQYKDKRNIKNGKTSKAVNQYDDNGDLIKTHPSIAEAARQVGCTVSNICLVLKGRNVKANGFRFRYADECGDKIEPYIEEPSKCAIKVNQYTLDGKYIKTWDCMSDIERMYGYKVSAISGCCGGKRGFAYGYMWRYADECCGTNNIAPYEKPKAYNSKQIEQYGKDGVLINTFNSVGEAAKYIGVHTHTLIASCARGKTKTAYGFIWRYADDTKKAAC